MSHPLQTDLDHILTHTAGLWDDLRGQRIFITGGTGFVGTWLLESLVRANQQLGLNASVTVLTRDVRRFRSKAPHVAGDSCIQFVRGDIANFDFPDGHFTFVIHASTERQFEPNQERPAGMFDADVQATRRVLDFARARGASRLLFISSGAAYGKQPHDLSNMPESYSGAPVATDPHAAYGEAKRVGEYLCAAHARQYGFTACIARLFAFVGPHLPLDLNFAVGNFISDVLRGGPVAVAGDGTPLRSYLYSADMVIWLWTILLRGESARIYNVGSPSPVTIAQLAHSVIAATVPATKIVIAKESVPGAPASRYIPDIHRAESELSLRVLVPLEEAIRRTFAWHRQQR